MGSAAAEALVVEAGALVVEAPVAVVRPTVAVAGPHTEVGVGHLTALQQRMHPPHPPTHHQHSLEGASAGAHAQDPALQPEVGAVAGDLAPRGVTGGAAQTTAAGTGDVVAHGTSLVQTLLFPHLVSHNDWPNNMKQLFTTTVQPCWTAVTVY